MIRGVILRAAESAVLRRWMENSPHAQAVTRRFVAGNTLDAAVAAVQALASQGLASSLDTLGESVADANQAAEAADQYLASIRRIALLNLPSTISLKLTQLGLDISSALAGAHLETIVDEARQCGNIRVEVDMEASSYVDRTLDLVAHVHQRGGSVRAVLQAYLYRTKQDIERMNRLGIPVRLCKGAYKEAPHVAIPRKSDVDDNYVFLATLLLREGVHPAIATHDDRMLAASIREIERLAMEPHQYEFQMLFGIRRETQLALVSRGHAVRVYIPYGDAWYPYLMRRLAERPANLLFMVRHFFH